MPVPSSLSILAAASSAADSAPPSEVGAELELVTAEILDSITASDHDSPLLERYLSIDFLMRLDNVVTVRRRAEIVEVMKIAAATRRPFSFKSFATCSSYDDTRKTAVIWVTGRLQSYFYRKMGVEQVIRCAWSKKRGQWKLDSMHFISGGSFLDS